MALVVMVSGAAFASATNLLLNPGFETGNFSGWTISGTSPNYGVDINGPVITGTYPAFGTTTVLVRSGTYAGYAVVCSSGPCSPSGDDPSDYLNLSQTVSLTAGMLDTASFWVASGSGLAYGNGSEILVDGSPIALSLSNVTSSYQLVSGTFTTSGGTYDIGFRIAGSGYGDAGFSFDDFSLTETPEPATYATFGTGLLLLAGFGRKLFRRPRTVS